MLHVKGEQSDAKYFAFARYSWCCLPASRFRVFPKKYEISVVLLSTATKLCDKHIHIRMWYWTSPPGSLVINGLPILGTIGNDDHSHTNRTASHILGNRMYCGIPATCSMLTRCLSRVDLKCQRQSVRTLPRWKIPEVTEICHHVAHDTSSMKTT